MTWDRPTYALGLGDPFVVVLSSAESEVWISDLPPPWDALQRGSARSTSTPCPSCTATGPTCPSCPTCETPTACSSTGLSTCCTVATPASPSATQANEEATPTPAIFGQPSHQPFAYYDPGSSSVRTSQGTLLSDSTPSLVTLPRWGSMCGGELYELPTPGHLTNGHGCSGLPLLPGVNSADGGSKETHRQVGTRLELYGAVALLPTAHAQEPGFLADRARTRDGEIPTHGNQRWYDAETGRLMQKGLSQVVALLPTPMSSTYEQGGDGGELRAAIQHGPTRRLLPTPTSQDGKQNALNETEAERNPHTMWATMHRLSHGACTSPPSDGGNTPPDNQPPAQLTIEDA